MKTTISIFTILSLFLVFSSCVEKQDVNSVSNEAVQPKGNANAKATWREKAKNAQAQKGQRAQRPTSAKANRPNQQSSPAIAKVKAKYKKPIVTEKNKGVFITEATQCLSITPAQANQLDKLIVKYKRKGQDFRFFGGFYANNKPFARDLSKFLSPLEVEKFKHFHAFWFDRIPYPEPNMPVSLYYRLKLSKDQFNQVVELYSQASITGAARRKQATLSSREQIMNVLNAGQKTIYKEILSISK